MKVVVVRSARRRKTVQARMVDGVLRVSIPASMSDEEERRWIDEMRRRMERRSSADRIDLARRARTLSTQLGLRLPASIRWVDNQETRWGSCTPRDRTIRISSKLTREPAWVVDYVIVHELAHLSEAGHGPRFWQLVNRYPLAERARGFLIARGMESGEPDEGAAPDRVAGAPAVAPGAQLRPAPAAAAGGSKAGAVAARRPRRQSSRSVGGG